MSWLAAKMAESMLLIQAGIWIAAILTIASVWYKTKMVIPTGLTVLISAAVLFFTSTGGLHWLVAQMQHEANTGNTVTYIQPAANVSPSAAPPPPPADCIPGVNC